MADVTTLAGGKVSRNTPSKNPYFKQVEIDFAEAAVAIGSALAAADTIAAITVPANTMILNAGMVTTVVHTDASADLALDLGVTGIDADAFADAWAYDDTAVGGRSQNAAAFQPIIITTEDTIDILIQAATTAPTAGKVIVWAWLVDISSLDEAVSAQRDTQA